MTYEDSISDLDVGAVAASLSAFVVYNIVFFISISRNPHMQLAINLKNSTRWLAKHRDKTDSPTSTLAIQTLRSTIMVGIFVGGYAFTGAISMMNGYTANETLRDKIRAVILAALLFSSMLCWAIVIRIASHVGYVVETFDYLDKTEIDNVTVVTNKKNKNGVRNRFTRALTKQRKDTTSNTTTTANKSSVTRNDNTLESTAVVERHSTTVDPSITGTENHEITSNETAQDEMIRLKLERTAAYGKEQKFLEEKAKSMMRHMLIFFRYVSCVVVVVFLCTKSV